jgi:hypothetical protein
MSKPTFHTCIKLSIYNGLITGAISTAVYALFARPGNELWIGYRFHVSNYIAMILVCCLNTFIYFGLLRRLSVNKRWGGGLLGGIVAIGGSFLCSMVMAIGAGSMADLLFITAFFFPLSGLIGAIAGWVLAHQVMKQAS